MNQKIVFKTPNNRNQIKAASASGGNIVAENREIFQELKEIKSDVKKILNGNKKRDITFPNQNKVEKVKEVIEIIGLEVKKQELTVLLNDNRKMSIPLDWFAKWGIKNISANKLKNYEIWRGKNIHFTDINEVLGIEKFIYGFNAPCE